MPILSLGLTPRYTPGTRTEDPARFPNVSSPIVGYEAGAIESDHAKSALQPMEDTLRSRYDVRKGPQISEDQAFHFEQILGLQPYEHPLGGPKKS